MQGVNIKNLHIAYGENVVFDNFNIHFAEHKISVLLGGSGVGKTTLLNAVAGLVPYDGSIEKSEGGVSYIFQNDRLIPTISVFQNLDLILRAICKDKEERKRRIDEMLSLLEISEYALSLPTALSGGQAQRVAMARAYLYPSDILLLDEPFKALDTALKARLLKHLIMLNERQKRTVIFVTHAIDECLLVADDYYVLADSPVKIAHSGSIDSDKLARRLDDTALSETRNKLLKIMFEV
ncbi:MAG: ATP-binding cassette domain-containing protein [Clostridia bacterium]|nr:ATP-binding cassette domain-containing protein [Clostridia bacterium]